jgi:putative sugar O-methyltransferase
MGQAYYDKLTLHARGWVTDNWDEICKNDLYGDPVRLHFDHALSPVNSCTMRYVWNAWETVTNLRIEGRRVVEIGGGYGGLARLICQFGKPSEYTIVDLPEALALSEMYLRRYELSTKLAFLRPDEAMSGDVFIANYSLAEFGRNVQMHYLDAVVSKSDSGYFTHNVPLPQGNQMSRTEFERYLDERFDVCKYIEALPSCENSMVYVCKEKSSS